MGVSRMAGRVSGAVWSGVRSVDWTLLVSCAASFAGVLSWFLGWLGGGGVSGPGRVACMSFWWHRPFRSYGTLKAQKLLTSLLVSSFQQFRGFVDPGWLVLLRWCACRFPRFWGLFSVVWTFFGGGGSVGFWWVVRCMMPIGLVRVFPPGPDNLGCWAFCLRDFRYPYVEVSRRSALEFLRLRVVLTAFLAWAITMVHFLYLFYKFICWSLFSLAFVSEGYNLGWFHLILLLPTVFYIRIYKVYYYYRSDSAIWKNHMFNLENSWHFDMMRDSVLVCCFGWESRW